MPNKTQYKSILAQSSLMTNKTVVSQDYRQKKKRTPFTPTNPCAPPFAVPTFSRPPCVLLVKMIANLQPDECEAFFRFTNIVHPIK